MSVPMVSLPALLSASWSLAHAFAAAAVAVAVGEAEDEESLEGSQRKILFLCVAASLWPVIVM